MKTPTGPKGQKRPAVAIGPAVQIAQIATGEIEDETPDDDKDPTAKAPGGKGGRKRAENMTPERRKEIAQKAAAKRGLTKNSKHTRFCSIFMLAEFQQARYRYY